MARNPRKRGKMALYEVIGKDSSKSGYRKRLERLQPDKDDKAGPAPPEAAKPIRRAASRWPRKPRIIQLNAGRIEFSVPYQVAVAVLLGIALAVMAAFRLGQTASVSQPAVTDAGGTPPGMTTDVPKTGKEISPDREKTTPPTSTGNHRIVIQTYAVRADLEPVKQYFAQFGIETRIVPIDDRWFLLTEQKYDDPTKPGTDGYLARQKIIELGVKYKPPQGYEPFGAKSFQTAYGMRFED